jgi:hypothetical protein
LTQREYERAVVALQGTASAHPGDDDFIRRRELDLNIDYRLGTAFPPDRREALWRIQQRVEQRRLRLAASWLAAMLTPRLLLGRANRIARFVVDEYAKVLTPDELEAYFGVDMVANPSLPLDDEP